MRKRASGLGHQSRQVRQLTGQRRRQEAHHQHVARSDGPSFVAHGPDAAPSPCTSPLSGDHAPLRPWWAYGDDLTRRGEPEGGRQGRPRRFGGALGHVDAAEIDPGHQVIEFGQGQLRHELRIRQAAGHDEATPEFPGDARRQLIEPPSPKTKPLSRVQHAQIERRSGAIDRRSGQRLPGADARRRECKHDRSGGHDLRI